MITSENESESVGNFPKDCPVMEAQKQEELEIAGPGGLKFKARGTDIVLLFVAAICIGTAYILWEHKTDTKEYQQAMLKTLERVGETQAEFTYVVSLTPAEREKLHIDQPESLRKKIRDR
jgi:hypothetical protein